MKIQLTTLLPLTLCMALPSCSSDPGIKIVKAKPSQMYELGSKRPDGPTVVIHASNEAPRQPHTPAPGAKRLRLPDMEELPSSEELQLATPARPSGGVIARPPSVIARPPSE